MTLSICRPHKEPVQRVPVYSSQLLCNILAFTSRSGTNIYKWQRKVLPLYFISLWVNHLGYHAGWPFKLQTVRNLNHQGRKPVPVISPLYSRFSRQCAKSSPHMQLKPPRISTVFGLIRII
jgi:hypothetical protein